MWDVRAVGRGLPPIALALVGACVSASRGVNTAAAACDSTCAIRIQNTTGRELLVGYVPVWPGPAVRIGTVPTGEDRTLPVVGAPSRHLNLVVCTLPDARILARQDAQLSPGRAVRIVLEPERPGGAACPDLAVLAPRSSGG